MSDPLFTSGERRSPPPRHFLLDQDQGLLHSGCTEMTQLSSDVADEASELLVANMALSLDERHEECTTLNHQLEEEIRRNQNLLIPISRLLPELLSNIFLKVVEDLDAQKKLSSTLVLSGVSSGWRSTCISTPRLWNTMFKLDSPEMTNLQLERSKEVSLHVICRNKTRGKEVELRFFEIMLHHMSRWKTVEIYSTHGAEIASIYLGNKSIPILEELSLLESKYHDPDEEDPFMPVDLNISAPSLTNLSVTFNRFPLRLEYGLHSNLRSLSFTSCINDAPFLMEQYHILLSSAPHLEDISIHSGAELPSPFQIRTLGDIQLHNLKSLTFHSHLWEVVIALTSSIVIAPNKLPFCEVKACRLVVLPPIMLPENIRQDSLLSTTCNSEWLRALVDARGGYVVVALGPDPKKEVWSFQLDCESELSMGVLSGIIESGSFQRVKIVELEGCQLFSTGDLPWTNSSLPCVEVLRIRSLYLGSEEDTTPVTRMIQKLSSPVSSPHGTFWICPRLRHIAFDCSVRGDSLVQLFKARCRDSDYVINTSTGRHRLELVEMSTYTKLRWTEEILAGLAVGYNVQARCRDLEFW